MPRIFTKKSEQYKRKILRETQTNAETILWNVMKNRKILGERFLRQFSIYEFVVDFYCPRLKLAIEVDGKVHDSREQAEYDKLRQEKIEELKIVFVRFRNEKIITNLMNVVEEIEYKVLVQRKIRKLSEPKTRGKDI